MIPTLFYKAEGAGGDADGMRILKLIAAAIMPLLMIFALILPREWTGVWAQLPPSNPNLSPATLPSAPPRLSQPAATTGIPPLATIPPPSTPAPSPAARVFNCSCFGRGSGTHWMGRVSAAGYFAARQSAIGACLSYNELKQPVSPFRPPTALLNGPIALGSSAALPGASQPADAAAAQVLPGTLNFSTSEQLLMCSQCTCD
jgi:hypothetical protein